MRHGEAQRFRCGLQASAHARDSPVICTLHVDHLVVPALQLGDVIGDVRHEVGVGAVRLRITRSLSSPAVRRARRAHRAFRAQSFLRQSAPPSSYVMPDATIADTAVNLAFATATIRERSCRAPERREIAVLLIAQIRDGKAFDGGKIIDIANGGHVTPSRSIVARAK